MILSTAALCLAMNIYHEARGEPIMGQYAVALVTVNRAKRDQDNVCREVFKPKQFSWTNKFVQKVSGGWALAQRLHPKDAHALWVATRIAETTLSGRMLDFTHGATFYHHKTKVAPKWRLSMQPTRLVGNHQFYTQPVSQS